MLENIDYAEHAASSIDASAEPKPLSREDGLSDRLKSLRRQVDCASPAQRDASEAAQPQTNSTTTGTLTGASLSTQAPPSGRSGSADNISDHLLDTDDQTLEELLADLRSDEQWLEEIVTEVAKTRDEEHQKVKALLGELSEASPVDQGVVSTSQQQGDSNDESGDDSDGESMQQAAHEILSQTIDQVDWERSNAPKERPQQSSRPSTILENDGERNRAFDEDPFSLPTVPVELQEQPGLTLDQDADFEASISSRMAALKGLGDTVRALPSAPTSEVDELGLPVAPMFAPGDRPVMGVYKQERYTDEDAKTWCTVCLEDGAVRCFGCDGDVYCARCWKEMHVGPSAGFDERGHRWEKFVKSRW